MILVDDHIKSISVSHAHGFGAKDTAIIEFFNGTMLTIPLHSYQQLTDLQRIMKSNQKIQIGILESNSGPLGIGSSGQIPVSHVPTSNAADDGPCYEVDDSKAPEKGFSGCYHKNEGYYDSGFSRYKYCKDCGHKLED